MPFQHLPKSNARRVFAGIALSLVLAGLGVAAWRWLQPWLFPPDPLITTPQLALEQVKGRSLYFNGIGRAWMLKLRPDLLTPEDREDDSARTRAFTQAPQSPKLFRQIDRQYRFDTIVLVGEPSNYRRLLDHFLEPEPEKREFRLVYLDHWALIFQRNAEREWEPADADAVRERIAGARAADRAAFLAMAAGKMLAIRKIDAAKKWLDEAESLDGGSLDMLAGLAGYEVALGRWVQAENYADKALERDVNCIPALAVKVVAMRATKHKIDAFKYSERLNKLIPEDPVRLWQHAEVAREAGKRAAEIAALNRLVELARQEDRPVGEYEFSLGEAHVHEALDDIAHAPLALEHLLKAVADPLLPPAKRKFAEERIATIRQRTGLR
jgi:tetratricopeptide (TPR) repeat protein